MGSQESAELRRTPLHALHVARGAKMVPFAGYEMPVQYPAGIIAEHLHTRAKAGLFDVSHMGQVTLHGVTAAMLETLVPGDIATLPEGRMRYSLLLNDDGGIIDDLMALRFGGGLQLVVNAATKEGDIAHLRELQADRAVSNPPLRHRTRNFPRRSRIGIGPISTSGLPHASASVAWCSATQYR